MTATILNWSKAGTTYTADVTVKGTVTQYEVTKTSGGRARLLINGQKVGPDAEGSGRFEVRMAEAEQHARALIGAEAETAPPVSGGAVTLTPETALEMAPETVPVAADAGAVSGAEHGGIAPQTLTAGPEMAFLTDTVHVEEEADFAAYRADMEAGADLIRKEVALEAARIGDTDPAAEEWERNLGRLEATRMETITTGVKEEVIELPAAVEATEEPAVPAVKIRAKKLPAGVGADGWTRKTKVGVPTTDSTGRCSVLEVRPDSTKEWRATVDGVTDATVFRTMRAAKQWCDEQIAGASVRAAC